MKTANIIFGDYPGSSRRAIDTTEVKKVKTFINSLHEGAANDGVIGNTQRGVMHGVSYSLEVEEFTNGEPKDEKNIKWIVKYHSLSTGKWIEEALPFRGKSTRLIANNIDMCGRFIYIKAYINSSNWIALDELKTPVTDAQREQKGELKLWHHNKFRWFDRQTVEKNIKERIDDKLPWRIDQAGTSLCGMASIFYLFVQDNPDLYKKFAKDLFRTGEATCNGYTVSPETNITEKKMNTTGFTYETGNMPLVDFITLAGTRNNENRGYKGGEEEFQAISWPQIMTRLLEKLMGYKEVSSNGCYNPIKPVLYTASDVRKKIEDINTQLENGYRLALMIDSDLLYKEKKLSIKDIWKETKNFSLDYHWVTLETPIKLEAWLDKKGKSFHKLNFKVYSWRTKDEYLKESITPEHFMNNYYGYIKVK